MYADLFGLRELPFNNTPDPRFFYPTPDHEEAMASLIYAVQERKGFVLLTGEIGAGKTLVARMMLRHFGPRIEFATINHAVQNAGDLMESVCTELEIPFKSGASNAQLVRVLQDYLLSRFSNDTPVVLVLDEAQNLTIDAFEQLRMVGNLEADDAKLLQIVIVGQPELRRMFASRELRQLRQRVFRCFHLPALSAVHTHHYIRHRITVAGGDPDQVLTTRARERVFELSNGVPRLINTICDNALLSAYSANIRLVDVDQIDAAADQSPEIVEPVAPKPSAAWRPVLSSSGRTFGDEHAPTHAVPPPSGGGLRVRSVQPDSFGAEPVGQTTRPVDDSPRPARAAPHPRDAAPVESDPVASVRRRLTAELTSFDRAVRQCVERASRQLEPYRNAINAAPATVTLAREAAAVLKPLVAQAQYATTRAEDAIKNIQRTQAQGAQLAARLKTLLGDTGRILEGLRWTSGRVRRGELSALETLKRLEARSRRAAASEEGPALIPGDGNHRPLARVSGEVTSQASKPASTVLGSLPHGPQPSHGAILDHALERTCQSLSDLRTLVRDGGDGGGVPLQGKAAQAVGQDEPVSRLERDVEELVEMIGQA